MTRLILPLAMLLALFAATARPAQSLLPEEIIKRFTARAAEAKKARARYTYLEDMRVQLVSDFGFSSGQYHRSAKISFVNGQRRESFVEEKNELQNWAVSESDLYDLANIFQFFLTEEDLPNYKLKFLKTEKVDELNTFVFEIKPEKTPDPRKTKDRLLRGQIWIDDQDFQIVKVAGHSVPEGYGERSARFETYYTFVEDKYWFPWQTISDNALGSRGTNKIRLKVEYKTYKLGK